VDPGREGVAQLPPGQLQAVQYHHGRRLGSQVADDEAEEMAAHPCADFGAVAACGAACGDRGLDLGGVGDVARAVDLRGAAVVVGQGWDHVRTIDARTVSACGYWPWRCLALSGPCRDRLCYPSWDRRR